MSVQINHPIESNLPLDGMARNWTGTDMARSAKQSDMKPFLFERSFDGFDTVNRDDYSVEARAEAEAAQAVASAEAAAEAEVAEEPIEVTYSEADFEKAKRQSYLDGHADGFREGHAEAMDTLEKQLNDLLEAIKPSLLELQSVQSRANDLAQANMARMMKELTAKLMPVYLRQHGAEEALQVISDCLSELQDAGRVTIHLSEETHDAIGERLKSVVQRIGFEGQLRLLIEEEFGPSDVRLDWGAGGAERRYETIKAEIDAAIDRAVDRAEAEIEELHGTAGDTPDAVADDAHAATSDPISTVPDPPQHQDPTPESDQDDLEASETEQHAPPHAEDAAAEEVEDTVLKPGGPDPQEQ